MRAALAWVLRRAIRVPVVLVATFIVSFVLVRVAPGGPYDPWRRTRAPDALDAAVDPFCRLDEPVWLQALDALSAWATLAVHACTGRSLESGTPVIRLVADALPATATLVASALAASFGVGAFVGTVLARLPPQGVAARGGRGVLAVFHGVPPFVFAPLAVLLGALTIPLFAPVRPSGLFSFVPALTLGLAFAAQTAQTVTDGAVTSMLSEETRGGAARPRRGARSWDAVRTTLLPALRGLASMTSAVVLSGIAVESVFSLPGLGPLVVRAAHLRDYNVVFGGVLGYAVLLLAASFVVELLRAAFDPPAREAP